MWVIELLCFKVIVSLMRGISYIVYEFIIVYDDWNMICTIVDIMWLKTPTWNSTSL